MLVAAFDWFDEVGSAAINFGFVAVAGGVAALVFGIARRRRESDLAAYEAFCSTYGRFSAAWKSWETLKDVCDGEDIPVEQQRESAQEVARIEGELEAVFVRITGLRKLSSEERVRFGRLRTGLQRLRECIEQNRQLEWRVVERAGKDDDHDSVVSYEDFKALAVELAAGVSRSVLFDPKNWRCPKPSEAQEALLEITMWRQATTPRETKMPMQQEKPKENKTPKEKWATSARDEDVITNAIRTLSTLRHQSMSKSGSVERSERRP